MYLSPGFRLPVLGWIFDCACWRSRLTPSRADLPSPLFLEVSREKTRLRVKVVPRLFNPEKPLKLELTLERLPLRYSTEKMKTEETKIVLEDDEFVLDLVVDCHQFPGMG